MISLIKSITLSDWGSIASLIGLLLSGATFYMVFFLKKKFLFRSNVDEHIDSIVDIASKISGLLQSYSENQKDIDELFAVANVELRAMQKGASGDLLDDIKKSRKLIRKYNSRLWFWVRKDEASARKIKTTLSVVSAELVHHRKSLIVGT